MRISKLGKPGCQLWFDSKMQHDQGESFTGPNLIKFIYGDILEQLVLFLAKEAGHDVSEEQKQIEIPGTGILGHKDADIDGVLGDVKSCSSFAFSKWKRNGVASDDNFGYMDQLYGYAVSDPRGYERCAFILVDKTTGELHVDQYVVDDRIREQTLLRARQQVATLQGPKPEAKIPDLPEGLSGNRKLSVTCGYCPHKIECWKDSNNGRGIRTFLYSKGPVFLTHVEKEPAVPEVFNTNKEYDE